MSLGKVAVSVRELYETDDQDFLTVVAVVAQRTIDVRAQQSREAERQWKT